jgi:hypothetical protein
MHDREIEIAEARANEDLDQVKAMNTEVMAAFGQYKFMGARALKGQRFAGRRTSEGSSYRMAELVMMSLFDVKPATGEIEAAKAEQREREIAVSKAQKEREIVEMRRKQHKMIETQSVVDELRAHRVEEEKERQKEMRYEKRDAETVKQRRLLEMPRLEEAEFGTTVKT